MSEVERFFFSSDWSQLEYWDLIDFDASNASMLSQAKSVSSLALLISGWHFSQVSKLPSLFPCFRSLLSDLGLNSVEDLRDSVKGTLARYVYTQKIAQTLDAELRRLIGQPIFCDFRGGRVRSRPEDTVAKELPFNGFLEEEEKTLLDHFHASLARFPEKTQLVVRWRLGINSPSLTLEDVGNKLGVSRERVRQIERKFFTKSEAREKWDDLLRNKLLDLRSRFKGIRLVDLEMEDSWFAGVSREPLVFSKIVERYNNSVRSELYLASPDGGSLAFRDSFTPNARKIVVREVQPSAKMYVHDQISDGFFLSDLHPDEIGAAIKQCRSEVRMALRHAASINELNDICDKHCPFSIRDLSEHFRSKVLEPIVDLDEEVGVVGRVPKKASERAICFSIVRDLVDDPSVGEFSAQTVIKSAIKNFGARLSRGTVSNCLLELQVERVVSQLSRKNWGAPSKHLRRGVSGIEVGGQISDKLFQINRARQWSAFEAYRLLEGFLSRRLVYEEYSLYYCLSLVPERVRLLGRLCFGAADVFHSSSQRIEVQPLVEEYLRELGRAASTKEIKAYVNSKRGLGRNFQVNPSDRVVVAGPGLFKFSPPSG